MHGNPNFKQRDRRAPDYAEFHRLMKAAREGAGLKQSELAQVLGRPQSFVSNYESGLRRLDVLEFLEVTKALGCDPAALLTALAGFVDGRATVEPPPPDPVAPARKRGEPRGDAVPAARAKRGARQPKAG